MATSRAKVDDYIVVEQNGVVTHEGGHTPDDPNETPKGPDPDRLANHAAEAKAFVARLRKESK